MFLRMKTTGRTANIRNDRYGCSSLSTKSPAAATTGTASVAQHGTAWQGPTHLIEVSRGDVGPSPEPPNASVGLEVPVVEVHRRAHGVLHTVPITGSRETGHVIVGVGAQEIWLHLERVVGRTRYNR